MELTLTRKTKTETSTIGNLNINGHFECFILEDVDRGLQQGMSNSELSNLKVHGNTCIPTGRYEIAISFSNKFQKLLPILMDVPVFAGIRIHSGNTALDTEGCLLTGQTKTKNFVGNSRLAFAALFAKLKTASRLEKIFILVK